MPELELSFASKESSLSVRRFVVHEALSAPFEVSVWARSPNEDLDLDSIAGKPAALRIMHGVVHLSRGARVFSGICRHIEQVQAERTGLSTYYLRIVPTLWLLTQRRNNRIFQHKSVPDVIDALLGEWEIEPTWRIERGRYPKLEYRVQYSESDYDFFCRLLEEAGITFHFEDDGEGESRLVMADEPQSKEARAGGPIIHVDNPNQAAEREYVSQVRVAQAVRPGKVTIRDFDFRKSPEFPLFGTAAPGAGPEDRYEQYHYTPGSFLVISDKGGDTPAADAKGAARHDEKAGTERANRALSGERASRRNVTFDTNALDLSPGMVFSIANHSRSDLASDKNLLVVESSIEGSPGEEWHMSGRAFFADAPYRPAHKTPKPRMRGLQSAIVVGPSGEEIHTDEFGRVRVQFHWDREGGYSDGSSCWMRVNQGWAGAGYGMIALPRIGQEVLVGFFEGDPDHPVVVGRVFNNTTRVPYKLPDHKTKSAWRSDSSPGSGGFNEIMFEDQQGSELVYIQAQRDLDKLVKADETERTGANRSIAVGANRTSIIGANDTTLVGATHRVTIAQPQEPPPSIPPTTFEMQDKKIGYSTGEASITFDGPNITIEAKGNITIRSTGGDVIIKGGPNVKINC